MAKLSPQQRPFHGSYGSKTTYFVLLRKNPKSWNQSFKATRSSHSQSYLIQHEVLSHANPETDLEAALAAAVASLGVAPDDASVAAGEANQFFILQDKFSLSQKQGSVKPRLRVADLRKSIRSNVGLNPKYFLNDLRSASVHVWLKATIDPKYLTSSLVQARIQSFLAIF